MKYNSWTLALASLGVVSLASVANAEEQAMSQVLTAVSATTLSGYVDVSAIWKPGTGNGGLAGAGPGALIYTPPPVETGAVGPRPAPVDGQQFGAEPGSGVMPGRAFDGTSKVDGFNLNVVGLTIEKTPGEDNWRAGYRADLLFGPDAVGYNPSYSLGNVVGGGDLAVKQAYVDVVFPVGTGLSTKLGVFNTLIGYESFDSYLNPNYSRSFGWQLEPTQHTGLLVSYAITEAVSISGGVADTWVWGVNQRSTRVNSNGRPNESQKTYLASLTITAPDSWGFMSGSAFSVGFVEGFAGDDGDPKDTSSFYVGLNLKTGVEGLSVGAAYDYRANGYNTVTPSDNWAWAVAGYLTFQATEKLKFAGRVDYTAGSDGTYYNAGVHSLFVADRDDTGAPIVDANGDQVGNYAAISDEQNGLLAVTLTADYSLWDNVISRAEVRWDHSTKDKPYGYDDKNAITLAGNLIYKF